MVIALFRHGLTEGNIRKAYVGWSDSQLSSAGKQQIISLKKMIGKYEWIVSSDLGRCCETAAILFPGQPIDKRSGLREMNFGSWEGMTHQDLEEDPDYIQWLKNPFTDKIPQGEFFLEFEKRILLEWCWLVEATIDKRVSRVAVVTHGGVIRTLLTNFAPEERSFWDWNIGHGRGFELVWKKKAFRRESRCTLLREVPLTGNLNG
ncbi:histidine phosphatase family protein [Peribacillus saganii]|uniref:histidine phosphatase family protein n=1 Tax=Peribacillus saganii TaxID=2303992 RepID=UPI001F468B6C|nr:histidine phosphatase family protein [Peribacillus saganii]